MNRFRSTLAVAAIAALAIVPAAAQKNESARTMMEAAKQKETLEGDLAGAIKQYQALVDKYGKTDHAVAAGALVAMAECYEKLGDGSRARTVYERVVRDYADQKQAVALARAQMGTASESSNTRVVQQQLWAGEPSGGCPCPSPDGRYIAWVNWQTAGNLALHDLVSGADRNLTHDSLRGAFAEYPRFTSDGRRILYTWHSNGVTELRIINLDGSGQRTVVRNPEYKPYAYAVMADGKFAAASLQLAGGGWQLALVAVDTGNVQVLKSLEWRIPMVGNFSPDGRWLVYSARVRRDSPDSEVYAIAVDGSAQATVVPGPGVHGNPFFTPDGSRIAFLSDRSGRSALWSIGVRDGKPVNEPELAKTDLGDVSLAGFGHDGSLYVSESQAERDAYMAKLDPATWTLVGAPKRVSDRFVGIIGPATWSFDGKQLAYLRGRTMSGTGDLTLIIRNVESGHEREFSVGFQNAQYGGTFRWLPDGKAILLWSGESGGKLRRLDIASGRTESLVSGGPISPWYAVSADGRAVFYTQTERHPQTGLSTLQLIRRDIADGRETQLFKTESSGSGLFGLSASPDGRSLAFIVGRPGPANRAMVVLPASGGEAREIFSTTQPLSSFLAWTPDSRAVLFVTPDSSPARRHEAWVAPVDASGAFATGIAIPGLSQLGLHPDGRQVAFSTAGNMVHVSSIRNLFPGGASAK